LLLFNINPSPFFSLFELFSSPSKLPFSLFKLTTLSEPHFEPFEPPFEPLIEPLIEPSRTLEISKTGHKSHLTHFLKAQKIIFCKYLGIQ
jgi:hypothetical protein